MPSVYESDPNALPDCAFVAGALTHLVAGNRGRLLDARRTPVTVVGVAPDRGSFTVHVDAFEDAGAHWELGLEDVARFQFALDATSASPHALAELERSAARFDQDLEIACDPAAREVTLRHFSECRDEARRWLERRAGEVAVDLAQHVERREGSDALYALLDGFTTEHGLADLEEAFTASFVTNPRAGETVKGHAIVLAELGLSPYKGKAPRNPDLFEGAWSRARRAEHLLRRLAFTQASLLRLGTQELTLYRAAATDGQPLAPRPSSLVSATFSRDVAEAHFHGGPTTRAAVLWRQLVPIERVLMTFLETAAMNERFHEAEAILLGDPASGTF